MEWSQDPDFNYLTTWYMSRLYKLYTGNKSPLRIELIRQVDKSDPPVGLDLKKYFKYGTGYVWCRGTCCMRCRGISCTVCRRSASSPLRLCCCLINTPRAIPRHATSRGFVCLLNSDLICFCTTTLKSHIFFSTTRISTYEQSIRSLRAQFSWSLKRFT